MVRTWYKAWHRAAKSQTSMYHVQHEKSGLRVGTYDCTFYCSFDGSIIVCEVDDNIEPMAEERRLMTDVPSTAVLVSAREGRSAYLRRQESGRRQADSDSLQFPEGHGRCLLRLLLL